VQRNPQTHSENPSAFGEALLFGVIWGWPICYMVAGAGFEPATFGL